MPFCLEIGANVLSLWRAATGALVKKISDLCFSLPTQRLLSIESESAADSSYVKSLLTVAEEHPYFLALVDSIGIYFEIIKKNVDLICQWSTGDARDILRLIIFLSELISMKINEKHRFLPWSQIETLLRVLTKTIYQTNSMIYNLLAGPDQIISSCSLAQTLRNIFEYVFQRHGSMNFSSENRISTESLLILIEADNRPLTHSLLRTFEDLDRIYYLCKRIQSIPYFYRSTLRTSAILLFRLPIFNSFIRIPSHYWQQHHQQIKKLQFSSQDFTLSAFPVEILQHSDIIADYFERILFVGWISRTQFQEIWVTFLAAINPSDPTTPTNNGDDREQMEPRISREEILENNATQW